MLRSVILLVLFSILTPQAYAQTGKCGTVTPPNSALLEQGFAQYKSQKSIQGLTTCLNKELSIQVIIVTDSTNATNVAQADLIDMIDSLNSTFSPICLSFKICAIDTVFNYNYDEWHQGEEEEAFRSLYAKMNVINLVLVSTIIDPGGAAGYAPLGNSMPLAPHYDMIVMEKTGITENVLHHEMGHFFGLYHTFENMMGVELVDGSNCIVAGDLLCDTPADIDPAPIPTTACIWSGTNTDPNGDYYTPMLGNLMSYHPGVCGMFVTNDQFNKVIYSYLNFRNYLY